MEILYKIKKALKKKNESIILDLYLKNYDKSNFYFALVFNKKIEKFKVLYVPIDAIDSEYNIEEYFCYQFIFLHTVNYILETINNGKEKFGDENSRRRANPALDAYYIELNLYDTPEDYKFTFSQFIEKDFVVLFDIIVVLFEHLPNIVSELCGKLLVAFAENADIVNYTDSYDYSFDEELSNLFSNDVIKRKKYSFDDISFLEKTGNRYYAIIKDKLVVIDYMAGKNIFNVSSGVFEPLGDEVYIIAKAIKENIEKPFYRLQVTFEETSEYSETKLVKYYLCYGISDLDFKIVNNDCDENLTLDLIKKGRIKIMGTDSNLKNRIKSYLEETYEDKRVKEIMDSVLIKES